MCAENFLLKVENLTTDFRTEDGVIRAVDNVSFAVRAGEVLSLVGESGCGKSVASYSILRLIPSPPGRITGGKVIFLGTDLLSLSGRDMLRYRGNEISMIFQEPMTSLNPVFTIGEQLGETLRLHQKTNRRATTEKTVEMLELVGIPRPEGILCEYPHKLSGGMRQRVMIAMALSCNPKLLIADEPTTALDVTIQAQILELMKELQCKLGTAIIFITHDLGVVAEMADRVAVMYAGKIVESANVEVIFHHPVHPYTKGLQQSRLSLDDDRKELTFIPGTVPNPLQMPPGCSFHPRCQQALDVCRKQSPRLTEFHPGHFVSCWLYQG
ncbi:MAG: Oligopeptide transport ATP-binding protein OppD [Syntrophomonadaceae bacterium]|nr:Oligopeptide transport ATP-binding protein OppD [Bacillota bacterium]